MTIELTVLCEGATEAAFVTMLLKPHLQNFGRQYPDGLAKGAIAELRRQVGDTPPELINDDPNTAPSKRLLKQHPAYRKIVDGPAIALAIGIPRLRQACPHFSEWLGRLEGLASQRP